MSEKGKDCSPSQSEDKKQAVLLKIEKECQLRWERDRVFEIDAPHVSFFIAVL